MTVGIIFVLILFVFGLALLVSGIFTVRQQTAAIIERFGKFSRVVNAGLNFKVPFIETVAKTIDLRVHQLDIDTTAEP